ILLLVAYALAFACATSSTAHPFRRMFNVKIVSIALLIGFSGFILMFWKYGQVFLQMFWKDQGGKKVGFGVGRCLLRIRGFAVISFFTFLPWLLCRGYFFFKGKAGRPL